MNKVILIGNLTKDPELSQTNSGISFCRFTLAVQRNFQNSEGTREADFLNIIVWRTQAENCHKYLRKGSKAGVSGRIQTGSYEVDGVRRYTTDIVADEVEFLSSRQTTDTEPKEEKVSELEPIDDDNLPF